MAIARHPHHCFWCGELMEEIHHNRGKSFIGDTFGGYKEHTCDSVKKAARQKEIDAELAKPSPQSEQAGEKGTSLYNLLFQAFIVGFANPQLKAWNNKEFFDDWYNENKDTLALWQAASQGNQSDLWSELFAEINNAHRGHVPLHIHTTLKSKYQITKNS